MSYNRMQQEQGRLQQEIAELLAQANSADEDEDARQKAQDHVDKVEAENRKHRTDFILSRSASLGSN